MVLNISYIWWGLTYWGSKLNLCYHCLVFNILLPSPTWSELVPLSPNCKKMMLKKWGWDPKFGERFIFFEHFGRWRIQLLWRHVDTDVMLRFVCSCFIHAVHVRTCVLRLTLILFSILLVSDQHLAVWVVYWCCSVNPLLPLCTRGVIGVQVGNDLCQWKVISV